MRVKRREREQIVRARNGELYMVCRSCLLVRLSHGPSSRRELCILNNTFKVSGYRDKVQNGLYCIIA